MQELGQPIRRSHHKISKEPTEFISTGSTDSEAVKFLNESFRRAAIEGVSDVHFEDVEEGCVVRFRKRGDLQEQARMPRQLSIEIDKQIRMKCRMSMVERGVPLDGKFRFDVEDRFVDVRVSLFPIGAGQSIVCRLLDKSGNLMSLDDLSMPEDIRDSIRHIISQPEGMFLVTGPTGSGKTSTLYGILQVLNKPEIKAITVEDPIEYRLEGLVQAQITRQLTFAGALKSILRQDPDVIMVGEIRDSDTAKIATQAALTGHIVLSTLHTNNASVTLNRMLDLGVDPNALSAAFGGVLAQRLVRTLCPHCRQPEQVGDFARKQLLAAGVSPDVVATTEAIYEPRAGGCSDEQCNDGWNSRTAVFELIKATPEARLAIEESDLKAFQRAAQAQPQYRTLGYDAMKLVLNGVTSLKEAIAVTGASHVQLES